MRTTFPIFVACSFGACGGTTHEWSGHLQSLATGKSTTFDVTFTEGGGHISGTLPSGEHFAGDFHESHGSGAGSLVGDRGTVLDCADLHTTRQGAAGDRDGVWVTPSHGFGGCSDQQGQRYLIRF